MPLRTGATAQLDAPEEAAVAALIAAAPVPAHAPTHEGGSDPISIDTPELVDAAVTLAKMADLTGPTMIGRETGTGVPLALTVDQIRTLSKNRDFVVTVGASGADYTTVKDAADAYNASNAQTATIILIDSSYAIAALTTFTKANVVFFGLGVDGAAPNAQTRIDFSTFALVLDEPGGWGHYAFWNLHLKATDAGGRIESVGNQQKVDFFNCYLDPSVAGTEVWEFTGTGLNGSGSHEKLNVRCFKCTLNAPTATSRPFNIGATNSNRFSFEFHSSDQDSSTGQLISYAGTAGPTVEVHFTAGCRVSGMDIDDGSGGTAAMVLEWWVDGTSLITPANFDCSPATAQEVLGDRWYQPTSQTWLNQQEIGADQHVKRSGTQLIGETLGAFRLLNSLTHSATTGQGANDHHAELHAVDHGPAGADALKLDDTEAPDDNTDNDATTSKHGLLLKLGGGVVNFLRADGSWSKLLQSYSEDLVEQTKAGTTFTEAFNHPFTPAVAGDYLILWGCRIRTASSGKVTDIEVDLDEVLIGSGSVSISGVGDLFASQFNFAVVTLTAAAHDVDIDYRLNPNTSGDTAKIDDMRVAVFGPF